MDKIVHIVQPTYRSMDGQLIKHLPLFNYSYNLPIFGATVPPDWHTEYTLEYCDDVPAESPASVVILTSTGYDITHALDLVRTFKAQGKCVILAAVMDELSKTILGPECDAIIDGYPDPPVMRQILRDAAAGRCSPVYATHMNLDFPFDYNSLKGKPLWFIPVMAGLGCRHLCSYCCYPPVFGGRYRLRHINTVLADLRAACSFGRPLVFLDANLYNNRPYLLQLCAAIRDAGMRTPWSAQCTVDVGDDMEALRSLRAAGCRMLIFGLESIRQANMLQLNKAVDVSRYETQLRAIHRAGISIAAFFMVGLDADTPDVGEILAFTRRTPITMPFVHLLVPLPGTGLHTQLEMEGRLLKEWYEEFARRDTRVSVPCSRAYYRPAGLPAAELRNGT